MKSSKLCRALNYFEHFFVFISAVIGCVSMSAFVSLVGVSVGTVLLTKTTLNTPEVLNPKALIGMKSLFQHIMC